MRRQKKHLDYSMWQCVITSIIHTYTEYVTFNSDNDFMPSEVLRNSRYNKSVDNDTHNLFHCLGFFLTILKRY